MDETKITTAIILNNCAFRERDSQIDLYTKDFGRLSLIARGIKTPKSKMRGHLEPGTFVRIMIVKGKAWDYLGSVVTENAFLKIRNDYEKLVLLGQVLKVYIDHVSVDEAQVELFDLLKGFLCSINTTGPIKNIELVHVFFVIKFLHAQGFSPELKNYLDTGKRIEADKHYFDYKQGGVVKEKKGKYGLNISVDVIKILRLSVKNDFKDLYKLKINRQQSLELISIINPFFSYNMKY